MFTYQFRLTVRQWLSGRLPTVEFGRIARTQHPEEFDLLMTCLRNLRRECNR